MQVLTRPPRHHGRFVYGGWDATRTFDDVYVLTIPGFQWFKGPPGTPRMGNRCVVGAGRQMISIGGLLNGSWAIPDPWLEGIGVLDMTELQWVPGFDAGAAAYDSPQVVKDWYENGYVKHGPNNTTLLDASSTWVLADMVVQGAARRSGAPRRARFYSLPAYRPPKCHSAPNGQTSPRWPAASWPAWSVRLSSPGWHGASCGADAGSDVSGTTMPQLPGEQQWR